MTPLWRRARIEALRAHPAPDAVLLAERYLLEAACLDAGRSHGAILAAARAKRFLSYADMAEASLLSWREARRAMDPHLEALCRSSLSAGGPLLSAIVVNRTGLATGRMEGRALAGFCAMAQRLGIIVGADPAAFLKREQRAIFAWAETHDLHH